MDDFEKEIELGECKHENVIEAVEMCPICGSEPDYCQDCGAEMIREGGGEWQES